MMVDAMTVGGARFSASTTPCVSLANASSAFVPSSRETYYYVMRSGTLTSDLARFGFGMFAKLRVLYLIYGSVRLISHMPPRHSGMLGNLLYDSRLFIEMPTSTQKAVWPTPC